MFLQESLKEALIGLGVLVAGAAVLTGLGYLVYRCFPEILLEDARNAIQAGTLLGITNLLTLGIMTTGIGFAACVTAHFAHRGLGVIGREFLPRRGSDSE